MLNSWYKLQVPVYYVPISISFVLYPATTFILTFTGICSYKFITNKFNYNTFDDINNTDDDIDSLDDKLEKFSDDESSDQKINQNNDDNQFFNQEPNEDNNNSKFLYGEESFRDADSEIILDNSEDSDNDEHTEIILDKSDEIDKQILLENSNDIDFESVHGYDRHCIIF